MLDDEILNPTGQVAEPSSAQPSAPWSSRPPLQVKGCRMGKDWHQVVIKADSEYLVDGMTAWIAKWQRNGFRNCAGQPVANGELFPQIGRAGEGAGGPGASGSSFGMCRGSITRRLISGSEGAESVGF